MKEKKKKDCTFKVLCAIASATMYYNWLTVRETSLGLLVICELLICVVCFLGYKLDNILG